MHIRTIVLIILLALTGSYGMSYYEYFEGTGISSGLEAEGDSFTLNGKEISIFSGALHYFRIHPQHWRDTLRKLRAAGLNTVETYMPWNLHNPERNVFDFGDGDRDMSDFLDVRTFIQMAQEEDLFVILRPGPYICSEWDFGGLPSWLLSDYTMNVRTAYKNYTVSVEKFIQEIGSQVANLSFSNGGSIIAVQIENEYGHYGYDDHPRDKVYLKFVQDTLLSSGFDDVLFFTSDTPADTLDWGGLPGVLMTANFQGGAEENFDVLEALQPDRPLMVTEFWTGWFDHWLSEFHIVRDPEAMNEYLETILSYNSSVNFYMFIGGTNFGFLAGANMIEDFPHYTPIVTSYDYDAPLTEAGDYGPKYSLFKDTLEAFNPLTGIVDHPTPPDERSKAEYGSFPIQESMSFETLISQVPITASITDGPIPMEEFSFLNNGSGQSYGYALYSTTVDTPEVNSTLLIRGHVRDMAQVMINGETVTKKITTTLDVNQFGAWNGLDKSLEFQTDDESTKIEILVENLGRVNYGKPHYFQNQKKGLWEGPIYVNGEEVKQWNVIPLEFKTNFVLSLTGWESFDASYGTPAAYRVIITLDTSPEDTFLDMRTWTKGVVFVNGFNLGRYWTVGPTKSLYLPAPLLNIGDNEFVIFEQYEPGTELISIDKPLLGIGVRNN